MSWSRKSTFTVQQLTLDMQRLDFEWLDPRHQRMQKKLTELAEKKGYNIEHLERLCVDRGIFGGETGELYVSSGIPVIKLRNITNEGLDWNTDFVLRSFYDEHLGSHVKMRDILVTCTGEGTLGRVDIVDKNTDAMIAVDVTALRASKKIYPLFLVHYLRSVFAQMQFERNTVGSTGQTHLRGLEKTLVIYPESVRKQERMSHVAQRYMENAVLQKKEYLDQRMKSRIEVLDKPERFQIKEPFVTQLQEKERRFDFEYLHPRHEALESEIDTFVQKHEAYDHDALGDLCDISRGKTAEVYVSSGIPIIKVRNVTGEGIDWDTDFVLKKFFESTPNFALQQNDILLTSTGDGTIGRVDMITDGVACMADGHVTIIRIRKEKKKSILSNYLFYYLKSIIAQMQFERYTVGSTGQTELNKNDVKRVVIVFPHLLTQQRKLASVAHKHLERARKAKEGYKESIRLSKAKFASSLGITT
jgi:type I restriction enzyme, S subunit